MAEQFRPRRLGLEGRVFLWGSVHRIELAGAVECGANVGNDVFAAHVSDKIGAGEKTRGLFAGSA